MKKKVIIQHLARSYNLILRSKHRHTSLQFVGKLKSDVHNFVIRDDISYRLPGKKDTVVIEDDDENEISYQKRILFNNLREDFELFKEKNKNFKLCSSFAQLRLPFVIPKVALAHRNCLFLYHQNVCLLLKSLDKYIAGQFCSSLPTFTDSLVCSTNNEEYTFSY